MAAAAMARSLLLALSCASCAAADAQLRGTNQTLGSLAGASRTISKHVLYDKLMGYWVGQLVGNFMGLPLGACETAMLLLMHSWTHETMKLELKIQDPKIPRPFEFLYTDSPMPIEPQTYYDQHAAHSSGLRCNSDGRGSIPQRLNQLQGAYTDDDTDIEFVTLHALMEHGLGLNYKQIAGYWRNYVHIQVNGGDALWFANKVARENMNRGEIPPQTGSQGHNRFWWTIDPQLVNEIWSAVYPGMVDKAVERAEWGAKITSDSWGTHPTRFYAALYSAAFFSNNVHRMYDIGMSKVPGDSPYHRALQDVRQWHSESPHDWRQTWYKIRNAYTYYPSDCGGVPWNCGVSAMVNGAMGAMAFLYGGGDFKRTVGIGIAAGFDCDNQAATLAGLIGVMHGARDIPYDLTHQVAGNNWHQAFNNRYVNERRPPLPRDQTNSDIVDKLMMLTSRAIVEQGGQDLGDRFLVQLSPSLA